MRTFSVQTLGCKVNQYEGEQLAELLRARGLAPATEGQHADVRVVHTCSVTVQAASKSRQTVRRAARLQAHAAGSAPASGRDDDAPHNGRSIALPVLNNREPSASTAAAPDVPGGGSRPRVIVTGCWATSDPGAAASLPGVDAVLTHHDDVAAELDRLLLLWRGSRVGRAAPSGPATPVAAGLAQPLAISCELTGEPSADDGWMKKAETPAGALTPENKAKIAPIVNEKPALRYAAVDPPAASFASLPVLGQRRGGRQRAFLKVQDGCDAHCTYCIIPKLRPRLWSKPVDTAVEEARGLVAAGHVELVLTGIFLGAYGQPTALRRRQPEGGRGSRPIGQLVRALCTRVPGLRRLRLSSLEPGDLTPDLIAVLREHPQVVPHFHLPLQSGSDPLLRRMNRQYTRDHFLRMVDLVRNAFDRPALTTDVIVGFPGESDAEFSQTVGVVNHAGFIHVHAFSFSPRPGTAAARWRGDFVHGPVVNERIAHLRSLARAHDHTFRRQFLGETVELLIEREDGDDDGGDTSAEVPAPARPDTPPAGRGSPTRHGRCERYFSVSVDGAGLRSGDVVRARVARVELDATFGEVLR